MKIVEKGITNSKVCEIEQEGRGRIAIGEDFEVMIEQNKKGHVTFTMYHKGKDYAKTTTMLMRASNSLTIIPTKEV